MIDMEGTHDNDDTDTWLSIGLQAALIVNKLRNHAQLTEEKPPNDEANPNTDKDERTCDDSHDEAQQGEVAVLKKVLSGGN